MARSKAATPKVEKKRRSGLQRFVGALVLLVDFVAVCALALTGYAGYVSPLQNGGIWGLFPLAFPIVLFGCVCLLVLQLFFYRRGLFLLIPCMLMCAGPILKVSPFNFRKPKVPEGAETFTFLTYNVHNFVPSSARTISIDDDEDVPQLEYVINTDADIVCLQEASQLISLPKKSKARQLANKLMEKYKHVHVDGKELAVLSKYPIESIHLDANSDNFKGGHVTCFRITMPSGRLVTLFNVHLESMKLGYDDRDMYVQMTELQRPSIADVKNQILKKISQAAVNRAQQAQQLLRYIRLYGGPDVIISGDFNDVPGCYTINTLADAGFKSVYPTVGFGPMNTFNASRMFFCIDHTLFRGAVKPIDMTKGRIKASDHYPLVTRFYIDK